MATSSRAVVRAPDGREWTVWIERIVLPSWRYSRYEPADDADQPFPGFFVSYLLIAPILWFVVPIALMLFELPVALVRAVFSSRRGVSATSTWPVPETLRFTTDAGHAREVFLHVQERLALGELRIRPPHATPAPDGS